MDESIKSLWGIQKTTVDTTAVINIVVHCLTKTVKSMACRKLLFKAKLVWRGFEIFGEFFSENSNTFEAMGEIVIPLWFDVSLLLPFLSLMIGIIVPKRNWQGTNECFIMWLNNIVNLNIKISGAFWKCSACKPSSLEHFPEFIPHMASIVSFNVIENLSQSQLWLCNCENSSYWLWNWESKAETLLWLFGS